MRSSGDEEIHPDFIQLVDRRTRVWNFDDDALHEFAEAVRTTAAEVPGADPFWEDRPRRDVWG